MKKVHSLRIIFWVICSLFYPYTAQGQTSSAQLPAEIKKFLDTKYPGWKFNKMSQNLENQRRAAEEKIEYILTGDFAGKGKKDYAVIIAHQGKWQVISFFQENGAYKDFLLGSGKIPTPNNVYVFMIKKGEPSAINWTDFKQTGDVVVIAFYGRISHGYIYDGTRFQKIQTSD
jgi:hypothetical protein